MKSRTQIFCTLVLAATVVSWLSGCGGTDEVASQKGPATPSGGAETESGEDEEHHAEVKEHGEGKHHAEVKEHGEGEHHAEVEKHGEGEHHAEVKKHGEGHEHSAVDAKERVEMLADYGAAMHEIEELRNEIKHLIESDQLLVVHPPAQVIAEIAKRLPELAQKSGIPSAQWKDINTQSRDLANLFDEIDEAADANKKPETEVVFAKMVKLIDGLNAFAPEHGEEHDEEHEHHQDY